MFVQVIRGKVTSPAAINDRLKAWERECKPGAVGFLGATMGTAADGTYVNVVRFESEAAARANGERPAQSEWWKGTEAVFSGPVSFYDCPRVELFRDGGSDDAGFVQVMFYTPSDIDAVLALTKGFEKVADERTDIIGGVQAITADGIMIDTNYFTSKDDARAGEAKELPADMRETFATFQRVAGEIEFVDIAEPIYMSK